MNTDPLSRRLFVFALLFGTFLHLRAADPEFYYYYHGAKRALELDASQVAVKLTSRGNSAQKPNANQAKAFADQASALGYKSDEANGFLPGGWITLATKSAAAKANVSPSATLKERSKSLIDDLAGVSDTEFVCPIFKDRKGNPVHFEATLLVGFVPGTSEADQDKILKKIKNVKSIGRHGPKNKWTLETSFKSGLDLLGAANEIAALPSVRYAESDFIMTAELH